jgi:hypothetical protein
MEDNTSDLDRIIADDTVVHVVINLTLGLSVMNEVTSGPRIGTETSERAIQVKPDTTEGYFVSYALRNCGVVEGKTRSFHCSRAGVG